MDHGTAQAAGGPQKPQEAFADLVGVQRTYMGGLGRGDRNLTLKSVERIAGWLDVEPLTLLADQARTTVRPL